MFPWFGGRGYSCKDSEFWGKDYTTATKKYSNRHSDPEMGRPSNESSNLGWLACFGFVEEMN